jgi:hypothetical protein
VRTLVLETTPAQTTPSTIKISSTDISTTYIIIISVVCGTTFLLVCFVVYRVLRVQTQGQSRLSSRRRDDDDWRIWRFDPRPPGGPDSNLRPQQRTRYDYDYLKDVDFWRIRRDPPDYPMSYQAYSGPRPRPSGGGNEIIIEENERDVRHNRGRRPRSSPSVEEIATPRPSGPQPMPSGGENVTMFEEDATQHQPRSPRSNERTAARDREMRELERLRRELQHARTRQQWDDRRRHESYRSNRQHSVPSPHRVSHVSPSPLVHSPSRRRDTSAGYTFVRHRPRSVDASPSHRRRRSREQAIVVERS